MKEIVENLHYAIANDPDPWDMTLYQRAADEIKRLRSLITAWANAHDAAIDTFHWRDNIADRSDEEHALADAVDALRKAVGR